MRTAKLSLLVCAGLFLADARAADPAAPGESLEARVQALIRKVKRTMRPLKGGTFDMGDWGGKTGLPYALNARSPRAFLTPGNNQLRWLQGRRATPSAVRGIGAARTMLRSMLWASSGRVTR